MKLKIDCREPNSDKFADTFMKLGYDTCIEVLDVGDFVFPEKGLGFERKAKDFTNIPDVLKKARELKSVYPGHFLVVEGNLDQLIRIANKVHKKDMTPHILGMVASLSVSGIPPLFLSNRFFLTSVMHKIAQKWDDGKDRGITLEPFRPNPTRGDIQKAMLCAIPGVGPNMAGKLLEEFGSFRGVYEASLDDLKTVKGVGKILAGRIYSTLHGEPEYV